MKKQSYKAIERDIIECIDASGYGVDPQTDAEKLRFMWDTFNSEYSFMVERMGVMPALVEYLQGLPSCCTLPFYNYDILEHAVKWGSLPAGASEADEDKLLSNYWRFMAMRIASLWNQHGIK